MVAVNKILDIPLIEETIRKFEAIRSSSSGQYGTKFWEIPEEERERNPIYGLEAYWYHGSLRIKKSIRIDKNRVKIKLEAKIRDIECRYFGKEDEYTEGCQYLRNNLINIVTDFFDEMDIENPSRRVEICFAVQKNIVVETNGGFNDGAINEHESMLTNYFDTEEIRMAEDFEDIETKILERYHVPYAIPLKVAYKGIIRF